MNMFATSNVSAAFRKIFLAAALALPAALQAQTVGPTIATGTAPSAIAINPVTNRVYVTNEGSNTVTVINGASHATSTLSVGTRPLWIAVNPETNKIFVSNFGQGSAGPSFMVVDGASQVVGAPQSMGDVGWMTVNPVTNSVFNVRYGNGDEVNVIVNDVYQHTSATRAYKPVSIAINPVTNVLYIAHEATGDIVAIDAASAVDGSPTPPLYPQRLCPNGSGGYRPSPGQFDPDGPACIDIPDPIVAVTVNPVTNMIYAVSSSTSGQISAIRGHGLSNPHTFATFTPPGVSGAAKAIAVNPVTNKVYAAFMNHVVVFNGATNAMTVIPSGAVAIGVNPSTNMIYAPNSDGTLRVISGATNAVVATVTIPVGAKAIAVNPVTNKVFVLTSSGVAPVEGAATDTAQGIPLTTTISPLPSDTTTPTGSITINAGSSGGFAAPRKVYFQIDDTTGSWIAATGSNPWTANFNGLSNGSHTIRAFATNALDAPSIMTDVQNNPLVGTIASYTFTVSGTAPTPVDSTTSLISSTNPSTSGQSITLTATVSGSAGTAAGTVNFLDGATSIPGCASVTLSSGSAACVTSGLAVGSHSLTARYSGSTAYIPSTSGAITQTVNAAPVAATVTIASSANPSNAGQAVTFTANVSGSAGVATGTVNFLDGATSIPGCAAVTLAAGSATCTTSALSVGSHSILASYSGSSAYNAASSSTLTQTVQNPTPTVSTNVALAANGGVATASSTYGSGFPVSAVINGERAGANWTAGGGWADSTVDSYPDWVQVDFGGSKTIDRIAVYTLQDNWQSPSEPGDAMTFTQYGIVDFTVQGWNGTAWVPLGTVTGNNLVKRTVSFAAFTTTKIRVQVTNALSYVSRITEVEAWTPGTAPPVTTNVALVSNGGVASASSTYGSGFPVSAVNNGESAGANWTAGGGWADNTIDTYPDWVQLDFSGSKTLDRVVVYTLQDNWQSPAQPTDTMTFSQYGIVDFTVQGWNGSAWVTLGTVTGNNLVKRTVTFAGFTTTKIRVQVTRALSSVSRITEIEAWGSGTGPAETNVALASTGAAASASSSFGSGYPASALINGERAGANWTNGGGWADATVDAYPDWAQVDFNGTKTISRVVVYTLQDNWQGPAEPTDAMTFTQYGIVDFTVQGWNGSTWVTLGTVAGNNLVKRTVTFNPVSTSRIRVQVTNALASVSRITEIEAWGN
jgi:YVTN family beta-propeller protein